MVSLHGSMKRATTKKKKKKKNARENRQIAGKNVCLHRARATTAYLKANYVTVPYFPPKSLENIWDELNRRVRKIGSVPTTLI